MKREHHSSSDFDKDPVWDLLRESLAARPGPNFATNVVRAARLEGQEKPWWHRLWVPASIGGALAGTAALVAVLLTLQTSPHSSGSAATVTAPDPAFAALQEDFETEIFLEASEHLGLYDDAELVSMIGF